MIERQLQQNLNKIENWATSNGFKFSKSKTQCVHFCQLRKQRDDPVLHLYGSPIPVVEESKFFGILFDRKLSFIPRIKYLKAKCLKALNLLKVLSHTSWGADRTTLLKLYWSLVQSKLDYGCIIYGSARKSYLQMLNPIHNQGLRSALGAFRTSPVAGLYVEADEPSLYSRSEKLSFLSNTMPRNCKVVIRITNKFILMGQRKIQRLVVLLYQTTIVICNVYLTIHQFSLLKPKQLI